MKKYSFMVLFLAISGASTAAQTADPPVMVNNSTISFTLSEKDLLPENIAYDRVDKASYIGSTRKGKIVKVDSSGKASDFTSPGQDGLWQVIGMKVDEKRRILWVCSSLGTNLIGYSKSDTNPAGIFKYDLTTGKLIKKFVLDAAGEEHFFNDLVLNKEGDVFITHMFKDAAIYRIEHEKDELEVFLQPERFANPNGITISDDGKTLYVAHQFGVNIIDIATREMTNLRYPEDVSAKGIDGIYFYENSLIVVKPGQNMVRRFFLDAERKRVTHAETLEENHPMFNVPTTGVIVGSRFYYIANSQFDSFNTDGTLFPMERLFEPVILRVELSKKDKK
ncbi:MAG: SMP-30/gluconolactonase/LRE family protein [Pyrinomonadaceae bacterium]